MSVTISTGTIGNSHRNIQVTRGGNLYACFKDGNDIEMWKSTNNGTSWTEQDTSNKPSDADFSEPSSGIDNAGIIHVAWVADFDDASPGLWYVAYDTSNDTWGTEAQVVAQAMAAATTHFCSLAVDSNNKPHVAWTDFVTQRGGKASRMKYSTNVSGTWSNILVNAVGATNVDRPEIAINKPNIPEIVYLAGTDVRAAVGNQNNATSFTVKTGLGTATSTIRPSIAIDPLTSSTSDTWICWQDTTQFKTAKHKSGDSWATWQTASSPAGASHSDNSMTINGGYRYIFVINSSNDLIMYRNAGDTGSTSGVWSSAYTIEASSTFTKVIAGWATYDDFDQYVRVNLLLGDGTDVFYRDFMVDGQSIVPM